ncbi:Urocanate hydratase [Trichinella spiralis]|uniref:Urocanate hydratase n=1 Tax=Trichinella spiralis TaxID=6334 RepID=A0ABR3KR81_TRISP
MPFILWETFLGDGNSTHPAAVQPTYWRPPVLFSSGTEPNRWIAPLDIFFREKFTASLEDNVKLYEVLKADLRMFIA